MSPLIARQSRCLAGTIRVPGDKSISHRALILGGMAVGETRISGLLESDDILNTAAALRAFGAGIRRDSGGDWLVHGRGVGGFDEPAQVLDLGNSGTGARLLMGVAAGNPVTTFISGDESLRSRPMNRVMQPLQSMGAQFTARRAGRLPIACTGPEQLMPIEYALPVASAQVKSAILLAGLSAPGITAVIEPEPTRDHTETMLRQFGAEIDVTEHGDRGRLIALTGEPELAGQTVMVPADPSSAAFPVVAALITQDSEIRLDGVSVNPLRTGLYDVLAEMGADLTVREQDGQNGEPMADLVVRYGVLNGVDVPPEFAPRMIDEYPVLAVAAAFATGTTVMNGLSELRVKESDRLAAMATGLAAAGVQVEESEDRLIVHGCGGSVPGAANISARLDHRIAMAFMVLGLGAENAITIDDTATIDTSYPGFVAQMTGLGARFETTGS